MQECQLHSQLYAGLEESTKFRGYLLLWQFEISILACHVMKPSFVWSHVLVITNSTWNLLCDSLATPELLVFTHQRIIAVYGVHHGDVRWCFKTDLIMDFSGLYSAQWTFFSLTLLLSACFAIDCKGWLWICLIFKPSSLSLRDWTKN